MWQSFKTKFSCTYCNVKNITPKQEKKRSHMLTIQLLVSDQEYTNCYFSVVHEYIHAEPIAHTHTQFNNVIINGVNEVRFLGPY